MNIPDDIYTEPDDVSPDTLANRSTTFLEEAFRTDYYRIDITFHDDDSWSYETRTNLALRGKTPAFNHRDTNTLRRVAQPTVNPLVERLKDGKVG